MANSDEKVSKFVQAITAYAEEQRQKIHQEVEDFKAERLRQAEQEVLSHAYQLIQKERAELRNQMSREMSRRDMEARKALLSRRKEMTETVFAQARERLLAYTATPAYAEWLRESMTALAAQMPAEGTVYELCARDAAQMEALCPAGSSLKTAEDIQLGGIRAVNAVAGLLADDTLDTRLDTQREWFTGESGLTIA